MSVEFPVVVQFVAGTTLHREVDLTQGLPIVGNGPPGTFVHFANGSRVSLPTDQIVSTDESLGSVRVGFGGMRFAGQNSDGQLTFHRVREVLPAERLSPARSHTMVLNPGWVASVAAAGRQLFPASEESPHPE